ncbi:hypothetical protein D3C85_1184520 [compost metagenome]
MTNRTGRRQPSRAISKRSVDDWARENPDADATEPFHHMGIAAPRGLAAISRFQGTTAVPECSVITPDRHSLPAPSLDRPVRYRPYIRRQRLPVGRGPGCYRAACRTLGDCA